MSVSLSSASVSSSATSTSSSFPPLPTGCAGLSGTHADGAFRGCVVGAPAVLQSCCSAVGSTPVFANQTCGCPFNAVFLPNDTQAFFSCLNENNQEGGCVGPAPNSAAAVRPRWKVALVPVVLGVSLWVSVMGA